MRMDRYDDEEIKERPTRTNKNQELYTDVYLNNAYVDISDLKEVMDDSVKEKSEPKVSKPEIVTYNYEEKNYDIVALINKAIEEKGNNKIKRSLEDLEDVENIIESINEIQREKAAEDTLLSDLMPDRDTEVVPPLEHPILDTSVLDTSIIHKNEMSNDLLDIEDDTKKQRKVQEKNEEEYSETKENKLDETGEKSITEIKVSDTKESEEESNDLIDDSFANETKISKKKIIFIILGILVLIGIVVGVLIWKKVIKF